MARVLVDTNIWLRRLDPASPMKPVARRALVQLRGRGDELVVAPQTLYELWVVLTRPATARGGFGFSPEAASVRVNAILSGCTLLPDSPAIFFVWLDIVRRHQVKGVKAHDARLVAAMVAAGVSDVLTFNVSDFQAFAAEGITVLDPATF